LPALHTGNLVLRDKRELRRTSRVAASSAIENAGARSMPLPLPAARNA
jgi:hypothetical protein